MERLTIRARRPVFAVLITMAVVAAVSGSVVAAERTVLGEYFNATW